MNNVQTAKAVLTPSEVLEHTREMVPSLRHRIEEAEQLRHLPQQTIEDARNAGIFSLLLPKSLGGSQGGVRDFADMIRILAQGDPSTAWTIAFLTEHNWMLARWPQTVQDEVFHGGGPAMMGAVANPPGRAVRVDGGYLVSGYWGYCSGVMHSDWVQVAAFVEGDPSPSLFLLPREDVDVQDTWHVSGMKGTGSHDIKLDNVFVPEHRIVEIDLWHSRRNHGSLIHAEEVYTYDARDLLVFLVPSLMVGGAEAMIEMYRERISRRKAAFSQDVAADTVAGQLRYARATAALRSAQAILDRTLDHTVRLNAEDGEEMTDAERAEIKLDCLSICRLAWESIDLGLKGSGSAIYKSSDPTQHFVRDLQTILSHLTIDEDGMYSKAGEILLGRSGGQDLARNFT